MTSNFIIDELRASTGERFAILLRRECRLPVYWPNLFGNTQLRARSLATNTILRSLRNIAFCYDWAEIKRIDLDDCLVHGPFLSLAQAELLANDIRLRRRVLFDENSKICRVRLRNPESVRRKEGKSMRLVVGTGETAQRIADVVHYLEWHANRRISLMSGTVQATHFRAETDAVLAHLRSVIPRKRILDSDMGRTGLLPNERSILLAAIKLDSDANPFRGEFQKLRNFILILSLYEFGCRRGESLQLKVEDIDVHNRLVRIHRSADDSDDPRTVQPCTKTLARTVPISAGLADELYDYIGRVWSRFPVARRRHGYLWTTNRGTPLALSSVNDMFRRLRENVEGLPPDLTPHTLRHDWNERLSETIDALPAERRPTEDKEQQTRAYLMGWVPDSEMARLYTRRFVREKAAQIVEEMTRLTQERGG